jgi:hypothetical protein
VVTAAGVSRVYCVVLIVYAAREYQESLPGARLMGNLGNGIYLMWGYPSIPVHPCRAPGFAAHTK